MQKSILYNWKTSLVTPLEYLGLISNVGDWLLPNLCLSDQNIIDDALLLLKKKFFFNDANINRDDPVGLHLLFVQVRTPK